MFVKKKMFWRRKFGKCREYGKCRKSDKCRKIGSTVWKGVTLGLTQLLDGLRSLWRQTTHCRSHATLIAAAAIFAWKRSSPTSIQFPPPPLPSCKQCTPSHGCQSWAQSGSDCPQMGEILDFFRLNFSKFWLGEPKFTVIWIEKFPNWSHLGSIWHT